MKGKEYTTLQFINSNKSFYNALYTSTFLYIDFNIQVELIILYFNINRDYINNLELTDQDIINSLLNNNYTIQNNRLIVSSTIIPLSKAISLVKKIKDFKELQNNDKVIYLNFNPEKKEVKTSKKVSIVIPISKYLHHFGSTLSEKAYLLEMTQHLDKDTLPFVNINKKNTKDAISKIIEKIILDNLNQCSLVESSLIYAYLNLYLTLDYAKEEYEPHLQDLNINQAHIGIAKTTYNDEEINQILKKLLTIKEEELNLIRRINLLKNNPYNNFKINLLKANLQEFLHKQQQLLFDLYLKTHSKDIYNKNLLQYILKSIYQSNFYLNYNYDDPLIKFFTINKDKIEFYCALHLSTLVNLITTDFLVTITNHEKEEHHLKLEVKNE